MNDAARTPVTSSTLRSPAVVYCEGQFGEQDGKTANGLVRHSDRYDVVAVIDSRYAGLDAGVILDGKASGIPIVATLADAVSTAVARPEHLICGLAPSDGRLSPAQRVVFLDGLSQGMNIVNGLHEFLGDDAEFVAASILSGATITDVRRPRPIEQLHQFSGRIFDVTAPRIAVLGTDGAIGKRTTATLLTQALNARGLRAVLVGTGQTTIIQGGRYGVALDALVPQYCSGEVENQVVAAFEGENPDVIIVEGQGALSHPAYLTSAYILRGSRPAAAIVQHAPRRVVLGDFPTIPMPTLASEIALIEAFSDVEVIGVTVNHEGMTGEEIGDAIDAIEQEFDLPATDPLTRAPEALVDMVLLAFPHLAARASLSSTPAVTSHDMQASVTL